MQRLMWRANEERGVALLTAVMISAIVFIMGVTAVQIAVHNSDASARNRRRVESIGSAEAGLDYYFSHLQGVSPSEIQCSVTQQLTGSPTAEFTVTAEFFDAAGDPITCPMDDDTIPDSALISSEGTTSTIDPTRTMESFVYLIPKPPRPFGDQAIFSDGDPEFDSNVTIFGGGAINADVYTNGDVVLQSNVQVEGSVFAQGDATVEGNADIKKDVWANGSVLLRNQAVVRKNVTSSTSSVSVTQNSHVYGNVQAGTTISAGGSAIDGLRIPNTPSDPPPEREFPTFTYDPQDWIDDGFTVTNFSDCGSARTFLQGITSGKHAVRITSSCSLNFPSNSTWTVQDDIAVISDGGLSMQSNSFIDNVGGPHNAFLIFGLGQTAPCDGDITFNSNSDIADDLTAVFYTPCDINMNSNSFVGKGQVFGGTVNFNSNSTLYFELIPIPGEAPDGFDQDITFIREVLTT